MKQIARIRGGIVAFAALTMLVAVAPRSAWADSFSFDLGNPNAALSGFTGPFVNVNVNRTSTTTAVITFTALTTGGITFRMGGAQMVGISLNATGFTASATETNAVGFDPGTATQDIGGNQVDGWGNFNLVFDNSDGYSDSANTVTVSITNTGGTWASVFDVLTENADGYEVGVHAFACTAPCTKAGGALATGFVSTPEPSGALLFGVGSLIAGAAIRRRR